MLIFATFLIIFRKFCGLKVVYIIIPKCACVCVCLCTFYLKTVDGNDLIFFVSLRDSSRLGFKILTNFLTLC